MARTPYWIDTLVAVQLADAGKTNPDLTGPFDAQQRRGMTVTRMLVHLAFLTTTEGGVEGIAAIDCGIGVASREAHAAASLPDPETEEDRPARGWLWRDRYVVRETIQGSNLVSPGYFTEVKADIRARRKMDDGVLWLALTNTGLAGTGFSVQIAGIVRVLVLLP